LAVARLDSSQQSVARVVEKIALEVLMITEPEVNFRKRRLRAVGESLLGDDLGWLDRDFWED